jgi:hypothetical protein
VALRSSAAKVAGIDVASEYKQVQKAYNSNC